MSLRIENLKPKNENNHYHHHQKPYQIKNALTRVNDNNGIGENILKSYIWWVTNDQTTSYSTTKIQIIQVNIAPGETAQWVKMTTCKSCCWSETGGSCGLPAIPSNHPVLGLVRDTA